ncbi:MAG: LysR family transcriptional regulator [Bdellovibrio sp.]|jgi:LysR family transcriptional regulator (chromosome initiation inhibitor)
MKIASHQLAAFFETARLRSFSKAADALAVTQSALSQRVANLEAELEVTLFIRDPSGPVLTAAGETLLRHCQVTSSLESEMMGQLKSSQGQLRGAVRVAGFSSVLRSALIPSLAPFLRTHPFVHCEFSSHEMIELADILRSGEADFVVVDYHLNKKGVTEHTLGREEYVVIESVKFESPEDLYLDHGPQDNATESFFREQAQAPKKWRRSFMGDVYGIINGVELGLGRAVMSKHLIEDNSKVKIVKGFKKYFRDVTLNYFEQPYYSKLHQEIVSQLVKGTTNYL